jgi:hypothetical protein
MALKSAPVSLGGNFANAGGNEQIVAEAKDVGIGLHLGSNVAVLRTCGRGGLGSGFRLCRFGAVGWGIVVGIVVFTLEREFLFRLAAAFGQLAQFEFFVGKVQVHEKIFEPVSSDQALLTHDGAAFHDFYRTVLELEISNLNGIGDTPVSIPAAFVADAPHLRLRDLCAAGVFRDGALDQAAAGAGIEHERTLVSVQHHGKATATEMRGIDQETIERRLRSGYFAH